MAYPRRTLPSLSLLSAFESVCRTGSTLAAARDLELLSGQLQPLTHRALWWACAAMPLQSLSVVARIHWHALRLWLKHVPLYTHPRHV